MRTDADNHKQTRCESELVVQGEYGSVTRCPHCNLYHLHIGPMSFRLEGEIFESVCAMLVRYALSTDRGGPCRRPMTQKH